MTGEAATDTRGNRRNLKHKLLCNYEIEGASLRSSLIAIVETIKSTQFLLSHLRQKEVDEE